MKELFIKDMANLSCGTSRCPKGGVKARRDTEEHIFLDIVDSTGEVQAVVEKELLNKEEEAYNELKPEASIVIEGKKKLSSSNGFEILVSDFRVAGVINIDLQPRARGWPDIFERNYADHMLKNRHFYLRNEKQAAAWHTFHPPFTGTTRQT